MSYSLGVDLGTTFVAVAIAHHSQIEMFTLCDRSVVMPAVVYLNDDGAVVTGEAANRRVVSNPERVGREFKRRLGDPLPVILGDNPYMVTDLLGTLLRDVVRRVAETEGEPPERVMLTHPANWGPFRRGLFEEVPRLAGLDDTLMITEPEAAAVHYAASRQLHHGEKVAVYDLGGGTFDATVLRKRPEGIEILGTPEGIERLGGIDFDEAILNYIDYNSGGALSELDMRDPQTIVALARLRQDCVLAKEALSVDTETILPVFLPGRHFNVRITRTDFEDLVRAQIESTIGALSRTLRSAQVSPAELSAVLLVGGSSRIPLVAQMVSEELGRPTVVDTHPKYAVALGAATLAALQTGQGNNRHRPENATTGSPWPAPGGQAPGVPVPGHQASGHPVSAGPHQAPPGPGSPSPDSRGFDTRLAAAEPQISGEPATVQSPHAELPRPAGDDQSRRLSRRAVLAGLAGVGLLAGGVGTAAAWLLIPSDTAPSGPGRPGVVRWRASIDDVVVLSAPALADRMVYLSSYDKHVYALDAATGAVRWKTPTGDRVRPSPAVAGGLVYVASWDRYVYALDKASGAVRWKTPTGDRSASFPVSPVVADGTVYLGTTDWYVYALDRASGAVRWKTQTYGAASSAPAVADGVVYLGTEGYVYALDAGTGTVRWKTLTGGQVWSSPAVADGLVYLGNDDNSVYALDAGTGAVRWKTPTGDRVYSSPTVADKVIYIGSYDKNVYALDGASGAVRWKIPTGDRVYSSPTVADKVVYVGSWDGYLYALDGASGAVRWKTPVGGQVWSSPTVAHTVVYVGSADGKVYAVQA